MRLALPLLLFSAIGCGLDLSGEGPDGSLFTPGPDAGPPPPATRDASASGASTPDARTPSPSPDAAPSPDDAGFDDATPVVTFDAGPGGTRTIPAPVLARKAIVYSGYRAGESPETQTYPTDAEIQADLALLLQGGWTFLRLYDCSPFAASVMRLIKANGYDIKLMSGIWISGNKEQFDAQNQAQIDQCTALYAQYGDMVAAVSVGNETLDDWSGVPVPPAELAAYIQEVRSRVTQPVTTDDQYLPFTLGTDGTFSYANVLQVAQVVDFLSLHVYAFNDAPYDSWDYEQLSVPPGPARAQAMMTAALAYTKSSLDSVRTALAAHGLNLPIIVGEAGWKTSPTDTADDPTEVFRAHQVNQAMIYDPFVDWVYGASKDASSPLAAFWFEAFDEPWKTTDDGWGIFDANRLARYAMWPQFPSLKPPGAPPYTIADAVYYIASPDGGVGVPPP